MASHDNSGVPQWLADLGIKPGEFYIDSKLKLRRMMKSRCFSGPARIYACLCLHSAGFKQELAVKKEAGKEVPLQPSDVCSLTGVGKKHFREHMNCLEASGLAKCEGLTKDRVLLYCYAVPRPVDVPKMVPRDGTIFEGFPPEVISLLKRYRVKFDPAMVPRDGTIFEKLQQLAQAYKEIGSSLRECLNGPSAKPPLNKDERKTLEIDKTEERGGRKTTSSVEEPEQPRSSPPSPPAVIPKPQPEPVTAVVVSKDPALERFEVFCFIMENSGRPVSVRTVDECRRVFFRYPPETQQHIVDDANIRSHTRGAWDGPGYTTDPLKYLKSEIWDIAPITARKFAPVRPPTQKEEADAVMRAHIERARQRDRERNGSGV